MKKKIVPKSSEAASRDGVFAIHKDSFIISDDLQIFPNEMGISGIVTIVGIADMDKAELIKVDLGFNEIMNLLKASLTSPTPLSDLILNKTIQMNSSTVESQLNIEEENANSKALSLKVIIQKSTGKFLYAQAKEDFVEFLFSFLHIPLGGVEHLLGRETRVKAIDNLYRSTADLINFKYFKSLNTKKRLMEPNLPHGCISDNHIFPLTEESLSPGYFINEVCLFSSLKFPNGQGSYLRGQRTYQVKDDLSVVPFCIVSILSSLTEEKISISDVKEVELQIGLKEALSILKASLTSTTALTDALLTHKSLKQPKREEDRL
ncbi:uncharacterized protein LOC130996617 [Salvia miltiorrhiza]|uniref:uncharacterized protein LOC130996617 n=1 Tax=Salvia miltiorrhiza TaxID=226208 RepID=UPI0025AC4A38|nr:uncharacterized protein LOC130996617 [Salvia miltiorrhiza]